MPDDENDETDDIYDILAEVELEFYNATKRFGSFHNAHEGYAVLLEEVDELWENVKLNQFKNKDRDARIRQEAIQVAAMSIRLIFDCCKEGGK